MLVLFLVCDVYVCELYTHAYCLHGNVISTHKSLAIQGMTFCQLQVPWLLLRMHACLLSPDASSYILSFGVSRFPWIQPRFPNWVVTLVSMFGIVFWERFTALHILANN